MIDVWPSGQEAKPCIHRNRYERLLNSLDGIIWEGYSDASQSTFQFTFVSAQISRILGYSPESWLSDAGLWVNAIHEEDRLWAPGACLQAAKEGRDHTLEYRMIRADGRTIWVRDIVSFIELEGSRAHVSGMMVDITEGKLTEAALREREEELRRSRAYLDSVLEHLPVTVFVKDAETLKYVSLNKAGEDLLGCPRSDVIGKSDYEIGPADQAEAHAMRDREAIACGHVVDIPEEHLATAHNGTRILHAKKLLLPGVDGRTQYLLGIAEDITEQKRFERELIEAKEKAEQMSKLKSTFLANMSHEIRTPLTSIIGFAEVLAEDFAGEGKELMEMIRQSGERLMETLNSVLDLAQLESRTLNVYAQRIELGGVVQETVQMFGKQASAKGIALRYEAPEPPIFAETDGRALRRVVINLVSNAVKFTDEGVVSVSVRTTGEEVVIAVTDTGIGIGDAFMPHLFEEFQQESCGVARRYEGSGLGLTITRKLVELLGGCIEVHSEKGQGSTFTVRLPLRQDLRH